MDAATFYRRGVDVLVHLHKNFDKGAAKDADLPVFGGALFAAQVELFVDGYFPYAKTREASPEEAESFRAAWKTALKGIEVVPQTLMLRDYMPDNLMDLSDREGFRSTGVLDFQDAGHGPIAYDIASLCEVVRRDNGDKYLDEMIGYYHSNARPAISVDGLKTACRILSAQRHMRILGVVVQHVQKTGLQEKLNWLSRIKAYLERILKDESFEACPIVDGKEFMSEVSPTAMILAAGQGMRMRPLTLQMPKPLLEVGGRTMLDIALDKLLAIGIRCAVVNAFYLVDQIEEHLKRRRDIEIIIFP